MEQILKDEKDTRKNAPQVMKDDVKTGSPAAKPSTRTFSTLARRQMEVTPNAGAESLDASMMPSAAQQVSAAQSSRRQ